MIKNRYQKIFKRDVAEQMRARLRSGESLKDYFEIKFQAKDKDLLPSTIMLPGKPPALKAPKKDPVSADLENAIVLHEFYKKLDETQASDPRLWIYLSHEQFRKYTMVRWGYTGEYKDLKTDSDKQKAINYFLEHWFVSGNDRDLRRHALARLWWAARLTYAPWEKDPEFFGDLKKKNPYFFTEVLLSTQDIYQQVLERGMGRSSRILISILDFLSQDKDFAKSREKVRNLAKELNLAYGVKKLLLLDRESLKTLIEKTGNEIKKLEIADIEE